jgi:plastocyanin
VKHRFLSTRSVLGPLFLGAIVAVFAGACSEHQDPTGPPDPAPGQVVEIELRNFEFSQRELRIAPGTTVRWRNSTSTFHTVTPDGHAQWSEWQTAGVGETFEVRFDQVGTFSYYCLPHRALGMTGTVIVE